MTPQTAFASLEGLALSQYQVKGYANVKGVIIGKVLEMKLTSAMINRGMATGACLRWNYKLDDKRISRAALLDWINCNA